MCDTQKVGNPAENQLGQEKIMRAGAREDNKKPLRNLEHIILIQCLLFLQLLLRPDGPQPRELIIG